MTLENFFSRHTKITRSLRKFILDYEKDLAPDIFAAFLENLSEELVKALQQLTQAPAGPERARKLHDLVENEIAEAAHIETSCQKGCSACCHMEVEITNYESEILSSRIKKGHSIDKQRLHQQSLRPLQDPLWQQGIRNAENRCVFLNTEGACGIYEDRPVMCRRHSVTSPARNCTTLDAQIVIRYFPKVDVLISAANEDPSLKIGPLAKMLAIKLKS